MTMRNANKPRAVTKSKTEEKVTPTKRQKTAKTPKQPKAEVEATV